MGRIKQQHPRRERAEFKIRRAKTRDVPAITAIMPTAFGILGGAQWANPEYVLDGIYTMQSEMSSRTELVVAAVGTEVVGCAAHYLAWRGENVYPAVGISMGIAVAPQHQGRGFGRALLAHRDAYLTRVGAKVVYAAVRPQARQFFEAAGYSVFDSATTIRIIMSEGTYADHLPGNMTVYAVKRLGPEREWAVETSGSEVTIDVTGNSINYVI